MRLSHQRPLLTVKNLNSSQIPNLQAGQKLKKLCVFFINLYLDGTNIVVSSNARQYFSVGGVLYFFVFGPQGFLLVNQYFDAATFL